MCRLYGSKPETFYVRFCKRSRLPGRHVKVKTAEEAKKLMSAAGCRAKRGPYG